MLDPCHADNADMPDTTTAEPFVVRKRRFETTTTILYLGGLVFALMVLVTIACVTEATRKGKDRLRSVALTPHEVAEH